MKYFYLKSFAENEIRLNNFTMKTEPVFCEEVHCEYDQNEPVLTEKIHAEIRTMSV